ncbi:hypothetical protein BCR42DRAFT_401298 [Absidia repens]|uniref:Uncharacterized protein n=1 Tax=Absidia repens TaxID=90262 RepID=A0A1X2J2A5_9FUNG|nr:hypothetical protein BCR42DRAFT_401298 [Absidia repens]
MNLRKLKNAVFSQCLLHAAMNSLIPFFFIDTACILTSTMMTIVAGTSLYSMMRSKWWLMVIFLGATMVP